MYQKNLLNLLNFYFNMEGTYSEKKEKFFCDNCGYDEENIF